MFRLSQLRRYTSASLNRITKLANGVRVATAPSDSHFVSAGIIVDAGSRLETNDTLGCAHFLDRMTFKSTKSYQSEELVGQIELLGGQVLSQLNRESMLFRGSVFPKDMNKLVDILTSMVKEPLFDADEIELAKEHTKYELDNLQWDFKQYLPEYLHSVAYRDQFSVVESLESERVNTLGRSVKISHEKLQSMTREKLLDFRNTWYTPERMVMVGVGVDHDELVAMAEKGLGTIPMITPEIKEKQEKLKKRAKYSGGIYINNTLGKETDPNPDAMSLTHVQVGYESFSASDPDIYGLATLGALLGGGGSFSAGGPGKGMYTRLYTQVLNRNGWIESCNVMDHTHSDSGIFGISASVISDPRTHHHIIPVLADQLLHCTQVCDSSELNRAKNQLKSNLLMSLESQGVEVEDMAKQVLIYGKRLDVQEMCERIDLVTCADLIRVGRRVFLGENTPSPYQFNDSVTKPWQRTGDWAPSVVIEGPLEKNDSLFKVEESLGKWGLSSTKTGGRKKGFFSKF